MTVSDIDTLAHALCVSRNGDWQTRRAYWVRLVVSWLEGRAKR
jgi:hypothetical protein